MSLADLLVGELMFSSLAVAVLLSLVLYWARRTDTAFFVKLLMYGLLTYNLCLSILSYLSVVGATKPILRSDSMVESIVSFVYVQAHVVKAVSIVLFCLHMLGVKFLDTSEPEKVAKVVIVGVEIPKTEEGKPVVTLPVTVEGPIPMPTSAAEIAAAIAEAESKAEADNPPA